jgi:hypothetical protein
MIEVSQAWKDRLLSHPYFSSKEQNETCFRNSWENVDAAQERIQAIQAELQKEENRPQN